MCLNALNHHVSQRAGRQNAARQSQRLEQIFFATQLVDRGPAYHALNRDLRSSWRNENCIAGLQSPDIAPNAIQNQIVGINLLDELLAAIVFKGAERTLIAGSAARQHV